MTAPRKQFWGKYRAQVKDTSDPYKLGRLKLLIPDVLGSHTSGWAQPCFPFAGPGVGLFLVPPKDAWVWAEFEHGDPDRPIWTGCFFPDDSAAIPITLAGLLPLVGVDPDKQVLKAGKWVVTIDTDSLTVEHLAAVVPRTRLKVDGTQLKLTTEAVPGAPGCATVEMVGNKVAINGTALEVM